MVLACAATTALATPEKAAKFYEDAQQRFDKGDLQGAVTQLKLTLTEDRRMLAAHLLLGKALLQAGELKGAEAAFEEALRQGVNRSEVAVPMGQMYLQMGETKKLLEQITIVGLSSEAQAQVYTLRGTAYAMTGNAALASKSFADARALDPRSPAPLIAEAPTLLRIGERDKALAMAVKATELGPDNSAAWFTLGSVRQAMGDGKGAVTAFDRTLSLHPKHVDARISRATLLITQGREKDAEQDLAQLKTWGVVEPRASYLRATLAGRRGDATGAMNNFRDAAGLIDAIPANIISGNEPLLMTGAMSHRALGNSEKARSYLETLVGRNPRHAAAQNLLAAVYVDTKDWGHALPMLENLHRANPDDPHLMFLLGNTLMGRKRFEQASEMFAKSAAVSGSSEAVRELGFSQMALGNEKQGLANIEKAFAANTADTRAGIQLTMVYMRQGLAPKALQTVDAMLKRDPSSLAMLNFRGNILGRSGDKKGARDTFQSVLSKDPNFRPAVVNLSWLDMEERRFDEARARLSQAIAKTRDDPDLTFQMGVLELRTNHPTEALANWQRADELQRNDPTAGMSIIDLYTRLRQYDKALQASKSLFSKYPNHLTVQMAMARAYISTGDLTNARQVLSDATRLSEFDAAKQTLIGRVQLEASNASGAAYNVQKALQSSPDDLGALTLQVEVQTAKGDFAAADAAVKTLSAKHPNSMQALVTAANLALSRGQFPQAVANYQAAMDREPNTGLAILLARAHLAAGEGGKAVTALDGWAKKRPDDMLALKALAEVQFQAGQSDAARKTFTRVLTLEPDDALTLSNYASLLQRMNDPAAIGMAERAVKLAPGSAQFVDNLGWILAQRGDLETALRHLRDARLRAPTNPEIRVHLAYALVKSGRKAEAKTELVTALGGATPPRPSPELNQLKTELGL